VKASCSADTNAASFLRFYSGFVKTTTRFSLWGTSVHQKRCLRWFTSRWLCNLFDFIVLLPSSPIHACMLHAALCVASYNYAISHIACLTKFRIPSCSFCFPAYDLHRISTSTNDTTATDSASHNKTRQVAA